MATYQTPGVYVEEIQTPLAPTSTGPGNSVAAFIGVTPRGPVGAIPINSWSQFNTIYGGFGDTRSTLPYAVYMFFANGGRTCYISRAVTANALSSTVSLMDIKSTPTAGIKVDAISPGTWGNDIGVGVTRTTADRFSLTVRIGGDTDNFNVEQFQDVSSNPADSRYVVNIVNSPLSGSQYVRLTDLKISSPSYAYDPTKDALAEIVNADLSGGSAGTGTADSALALRQLDSVLATLTINFPSEVSPTILNDAIIWAEERGTAFVVVDGPQAPIGSTSSAVAQLYLNMVSGGGAIRSSSYAALYGPWLKISDPSSSVPGAMRYVSPGGAVLGQYARTDALRSVAKAPAGIGTNLSGVLDLEARFTATDQDSLNTSMINCIKIVPGAGFCLMGARTLLDGYPDRYINVRRTLQMLRNDLQAITRFAIFEPNGQPLWEMISNVISQYLRALMQSGVLKGDTPDAAYYIKCDAENNPPAQVSMGRVNITVGVALASPAEFIVITLAQYDGGVDVVVQS